MLQRLYEVRRNVAEIVRGWEKVQRLYEARMNFAEIVRGL